MGEWIAFVLAALVGLGIAAQWLAWRFKLPAILFLLVLGLVLGPGLHLLEPDEMFDDLLFPAVSLGVAIILFEGALSLKLREIRGHGAPVTRLVTVGAFATTAIAALAARYLAGLPWEVAALFGAIVSVTGPTVIVPLLRSMRPNRTVSNILRWEGILIDPIGALLAVILFQIVVADAGGGESLALIVSLFAVGIGFGIASAFMLGALLRWHLVPDYLINVTTLAFLLITFTGANLLVHESGLLAVTVMGMVLANMGNIRTEDILDFKESLTVLLISLLFIVLAARVPLESLTALGLPSLGVLVVVLFIARPVAVLLSTVGTSVNWRERIVLSAIAPRGIVAAAVSALFAIRLEALEVPGAETLVPLTFLVILVSVILSSLTARPIARALRVAEPEAKGVLIVGGNAFARAMADAVKDLDIDVIVADTSWDQIRTLRMAGHRTYFGNAVSEKADRSLDLVGIGQLWALSRSPELNALACLRYRAEFGSQAVFTLRPPESESRADAPAPPLTGRKLFKPEIHLEELEERARRGAKVKVTGLTEDYTFKRLVEEQEDDGILVFAISPGGVIYPFAENSTFRAAAGWRIARFVDAEANAPTGSDEKQAAERARSHLATPPSKPLPA